MIVHILCTVWGAFWPFVFQGYLRKLKLPSDLWFLCPVKRCIAVLVTFSYVSMSISLQFQLWHIFTSHTGWHVAQALASAEACVMYWPSALSQWQLVSCCATLTDWATDSNAPVQLVYRLSTDRSSRCECLALPRAWYSDHASPLNRRDKGCVF